jgi:DNA replication and repair protein RecF
MVLNELILKNFRNHGNTDLKFSDGINLIIGDNGSGKTGILEGVAVLSGIRSFRRVPDSSMVQWGKDWYYLQGKVREEGKTDNFSIGWSREDGDRRRKVKVNDREIIPHKEYYAKFLTVVIHPGDYEIVTGPPELRRSYFDSVISKYDREYISCLSDYRRILNSRNSVLKDIRDGIRKAAELDIWDEMLAERGHKITVTRINFFKNFNPIFKEQCSLVSGDQEEPEIEYTNSLYPDDISSIIELLLKTRDRDIYAGTTTRGVHRDGIKVVDSMGRDYTVAASQGQIRTAALGLKITEKRIVERNSERKMVILIDDIFSELDMKRRKNLIESIGKNNQILMTMVDRETLRGVNFSGETCFVVDSQQGVKKI